MSIEFNKGELYIMQGDECTCLGEGIVETDIIENEDKGTPMIHNLNSSTELSVDTVNLNQDVLNDLVAPPNPTNSFTIDYDMSIMIQARWHKKTRIRKKWLKRFGMKPDTIKVCANICCLGYHPGHILDEQHDDSGICATLDGFEIGLDKLKFILRPDQKRKDLMFEW